jgi:hypothetical protein
MVCLVMRVLPVRCVITSDSTFFKKRHLTKRFGTLPVGSRCACRRGRPQQARDVRLCPAGNYAAARWQMQIPLPAP